jgi:hypothetical protein
VLLLAELGRWSTTAFGMNKCVEKGWEATTRKMHKELGPEKFHLLHRACEQGREV